MEFLLKVKCSDRLRQKDVIDDIRNGLHYVVGSGDPDCSYLQLLDQVKVVKHTAPKKVPKGAA